MRYHAALSRGVITLCSLASPPCAVCERNTRLRARRIRRESDVIHVSPRDAAREGKSDGEARGEEIGRQETEEEEDEMWNRILAGGEREHALRPCRP